MVNNWFFSFLWLFCFTNQFALICVQRGVSYEMKFENKLCLPKMLLSYNIHQSVRVFFLQKQVKIKLFKFMKNYYRYTKKWKSVQNEYIWPLWIKGTVLPREHHRNKRLLKKNDRSNLQNTNTVRYDLKKEFYQRVLPWTSCKASHQNIVNVHPACTFTQQYHFIEVFLTSEMLRRTN